MTMAMKRNEIRVPKFDEIIFENRNREYGAYDLRKRYKSVTSFSILIAVTLCVTVVTVIFVKSEDPAGSQVQAISVVAVIDDYDPSLVQISPAVKPPAEFIEAPQNVAPEIVTDSAVLTSFIPIMEELTRTVTDGDVNDTIMVIADNPVEIVPPEPEPYVFVEEMPEFQGGNKALLAFIAKNLVYPSEALD